MKRRDVLKGIGLSLGFVVATPSIIGLLQSCKRADTLNWQPAFFSKDQMVVLTNLVDLILPKTNDLPGALDVKVPQFIDAYLSDVSKPKDQKEFKQGIDAIIKNLGKPVSDLKTSDYDALLAQYLKADKTKLTSIKKDKNEALIYDTLTSLRGFSIWAYKTSEQVGEKVLAYDPIPGELIGCMPLQDATGGKAWSL
jgi:glucoside 3-dehydrogenase (cytochrome c) hitch-hiker subunit